MTIMDIFNGLLFSWSITGILIICPVLIENYNSKKVLLLSGPIIWIMTCIVFSVSKILEWAKK